MATFLVDTNVLVALGWPGHLHYRSARKWLASLTNDEWATCPLTECGFVRISSNPKCFPTATNPDAAISLLKQLVEVGRHHFWEGSISLRDDGRIKSSSLNGHQQVTDAHLLSLCMERGGRLATFDKGLFALAVQNQAQSHVHLLQE